MSPAFVAISASSCMAFLHVFSDVRKRRTILKIREPPDP